MRPYSHKLICKISKKWDLANSWVWQWLNIQFTLSGLKINRLKSMKPDLLFHPFHQVNLVFTMTLTLTFAPLQQHGIVWLGGGGSRTIQRDHAAHWVHERQLSTRILPTNKPADEVHASLSRFMPSDDSQVGYSYYDPLCRKGKDDCSIRYETSRPTNGDFFH